MTLLVHPEKISNPLNYRELNWQVFISQELLRFSVNAGRWFSTILFFFNSVDWKPCSTSCLQSTLLLWVHFQRIRLVCFCFWRRHLCYHFQFQVLLPVSNQLSVNCPSTANRGLGCGVELALLVITWEWTKFPLHSYVGPLLSHSHLKNKCGFRNCRNSANFKLKLKTSKKSTLGRPGQNFNAPTIFKRLEKRQ